MRRHSDIEKNTKSINEGVIGEATSVKESGSPFGLGILRLGGVGVWGF